MWKQVVVGCVIGAGLAVFGIAGADDDSDRADLLRGIDDKIRSISSELDGFTSDSDSGDLDDALSYAREVRDLVSKLERVKGSDSRASDIVSRYPGYVDSFRDAARYLKRMKQGQPLAEGVADRCGSDEADLQTLIRNYVGNPDDADDATSKLPDKGKAYGRTWGERLDKLKDNDKEMSSSESSARFSVSDGNWRDVSDKFGAAVSGIGAHWKQRYEKSTQACGRLALGEKHPDIEKALAHLGAHTTGKKATVTQLKKDYNEWLKGVRKLREFSEKDRDELRDVMCRAGEYEMERRVTEVADRWASQISSVYGTTLGQGDQLRTRATDSKLQKFKGSRQVSDGLRSNFENLEKLKNYELRGSNNPKIRAKLEYGKAKHRDLQSSLCSGGYAELEMSSSHCSNAIRPGSGCRADCVLASSTCTVIEIKPNSERAIQEGNEQRAAYVEGLRSWYRADKEGLFAKYPKLRSCEDSGQRLLVDSKLEPYDFCPGSSSQLTEDPMKDASSDISESE